MAKKVNFDFYENFLADQSLIEHNTNTRDINRLKNLVLKVIKEQLTQRQNQVLYMYFFEKKKITQIATELSLNKSTVSRSLHSSIKKINDILKYYI